MKIKIDTKEPPWILLRIQKHPFFAGSEFKTVALDYGDIWIDDIVIERKTITDLLSSIADNRLSNQAATMREHCKYSYLLIEGFLGWYEQKIIGTDWHFRSAQGILLEVQEFGVCVVHAADEYDVPEALKWLVKRDRSKIKVLSPRKFGIPTSPDEKVLCSLKDIGLAQSNKLLKKFGSAALALERLCDMNYNINIAGITKERREYIRWSLGLLDNEVLKIKEIEK